MPSTVGGYSQHGGRLPREIRLLDGSKLQLRRLDSRDREGLKAFFARCSREAIRYRFMSSIKGLSDSLLDYLANPDGSRHVALIAAQGEGGDERIVAEGRYVIFKQEPDAADISLLVMDEMQRRNIATQLIRELAKIACSNGLTCFKADVLADNRAMLSLLRKTGHPLSTTISQGVLHYELSIAVLENALSEAA